MKKRFCDFLMMGATACKDVAAALVLYVKGKFTQANAIVRKEEMQVRASNLRARYVERYQAILSTVMSAISELGSYSGVCVPAAPEQLRAGNFNSCFRREQDAIYCVYRLRVTESYVGNPRFGQELNGVLARYGCSFHVRHIYNLDVHTIEILLG